jgi:hypothetical protein
MKKQLLLFVISFLTSFAFAQAPAFPGAEGHGRYVTGGRKNDGTTNIIHVTNLNNNGTGSLRWALSDQGLTSQGKSKNDSRTIVFDVGGVIPLESNITIPSNTTILGQTAPYPGITLRYYTATTEKQSNIIVRFIRFRRGQEKDKNDGADAATGRYGTGIIFDHCSLSWSIDEVASFYDNNNFTLQWCTIGESLVHAGHTKGPHGYGGIWGGKLVSYHHNLICHVANRYEWSGYTNNKLFSQYNWANHVQAENVDLRNCVVYNANGCYGGPGGGQINMVGNYFKSGWGSTINKLTECTVAASGNSSGHPNIYGMASRYFLEDNLIDGSNAGWGMVKYDNGTVIQNGKHYAEDPNRMHGDNAEYITVSGKDYVCMVLEKAAPIGEITTHTATKAYEKVVGYAGASLFRDDVDERYMKETKEGTCTYKGTATSYQKEEKDKSTGKTVINTYSCTPTWGRIDLVSDVNGYTEANFPTGSRPADFDADNDGIADAWEQANGGDLDPNAFTIDSEKRWYTNLEVYANSLVEDIMKAGNADGESNYTEYYPAYKTPTGISTVRTSAISATEYYDLNGRRLAEPQRGVSIRVERLSNGQSITSKVIK